jgi:raffinose/stachyose/melibiose transport system substrate-binding protein
MLVKNMHTKKGNFMKYVLVSCLCVALCLGLFLYSLSPKPAAADEASISIEPTTQPAPDPVRLYVSNSDDARQPIWEQLANEFSQQTGTDIQILTEAASTEDAVLISATAAQLTEMPDNLLDLQDSVAYALLAGKNFAVSRDEQVVAVAADTAIFGLIYNETLLAQVGYTRSDVDSFQDLKAVAEHITADSKKFGFGAFAKAKANLTQLLASYPVDCRNIWDLYQKNKVEGSVAAGEAVFCLGSNLDFEELSKNPDLKLGMLPLYVGAEQEENHTFCAVTTRYWCIRPGGEKSNQAAVAFLNFLVSPRIDGTLPVDDLKLLAPYRHAAFGDNSAELLLRSDITAGKQCPICVNPSVPDGLMEALHVYESNPTDENWAAVTALLNRT